MAMMLGAVYDALVEAHVSADTARKAAEELAGFDVRLVAIERELAVMRWMLGTMITLQIMTLASLLGLLWKVFPA
jgi:hypothetical protein